jgi:ABC-type hemin transport system ATPase subunit
VSAPDPKQRVENVMRVLVKEMETLQDAVARLLATPSEARRAEHTHDVLVSARSLAENSLELIGAASVLLYQSQEAK